MASLTTQIGGMSFDSCIMNVAGVKSRTYRELAEIGRSKSGAIVTASMTVDRRGEAPVPNYHRFALGALTSRTFPNLGYKRYGEIIPKLKQPGKPVIASVAGFEADEFVEITGYISNNGADLIELNTQCNYSVDGRVIGYNIKYNYPMIDSLVTRVRQATRKPLGIKIPVCSEAGNLEAFARLAIEKKLDFITVDAPANMGFLIDVETERAVLAGDGLGNVSGPAMKPLTLACVRIMHECLNSRIPIIGAGGVSSGSDVFEYLLAGASAVQVGTAFRDEGVGVFSRLSNELSDILDGKGYRSLEHVVGRMKVLSAR